MEISSRRISSILTLLLIPPKHLKSPLLCTPRMRDSLVHVEEKDADKDDRNECQYDDHGYLKRVSHHNVSSRAMRVHTMLKTTK